LVELAKSKPGQLNWATWGMGSFAHLTLEWVNANTGARFTHVPYKTPDQALNAVITGEAHVTQNNPLIALPHIKAGKLKALAVAGHKRAASLPGVPAFTEAGYDLDFAGWNGLFAPVGTPRAIVQRLNAEVNAFLADPKFAEQFLTPLSAEAAGGSPEEFAAFLKVDLDTAGKLAKIANLKAQ
jgi:tripartite-type tricarboxylate transporter receptor subunit TctC